MKKIASALAIGMALASTSAFAADGTITINGEVSAVTCNLSINGQGKNPIVTLPTLSTSAFTGIGSVAGLTQFTFELSGCLNSTGKAARAYFEPNATGVGGLGNVINTSGTGSGLAFQLLNKDKKFINPNLDVMNQDPDDTLFGISSGGAATMIYYTQYVQVTSPISPGTIKGSVAYDIHYQ